MVLKRFSYGREQFLLDDIVRRTRFFIEICTWFLNAEFRNRSCREFKFCSKFSLQNFL